MSSSIGIASNDTTQSSGKSAVPRQGDPVVLPYLIPPAKERCPFDDLPTELTENILTFVVWAYDQRDSGFVETGTGGEVIKHDIRTRLSLVCNSWKEVIRGAAALWDDLYINENTPLSRVKTYLERSKECGLRIKFEIWDGNASSFDGIWSLVAPHVARLVQFDLNVSCYRSFCRGSDDGALRRLLESLACARQATQLETLRLRFCTDEGSDSENTGTSSALIFGGQAPALKHLGIGGVNVDWEGMEWSKALEHLKLKGHIESARPSYATFARVLSSFSNLKTLHLDESGPSGSPEDWPSDPAITVLYTVEHLVLANQSCAYACALLHRLAFPNLKSLTLNLPAYHTIDIHYSYDDLIHTLCSRRPAITKSNGEPEDRHWETMVSKLECLQLEYVRCSSRATQRLYESLDNLRTLSLKMSSLDTTFMESLYPASARSVDYPEDSVLLPRLESLTFGDTEREKIRKFMDIRDRRAAVGYPLRCLLQGHGEDVRGVDVDMLNSWW